MSVYDESPCATLLKAVRGAVLALSAAFFAASGLCAKFPERPIRLIVPFPAGNPLDVRARQLSNHLPKLLGQQIVVDNRGGASGTIAMEIAAGAPADGYTVLFANSTQLASNPALSPTLPYNVFTDYRAVCLLAKTPSLFVVSNTVPAKTLQELTALARARPGQLNFASQGNGTVQHIAGELFMRLTGTKMVHVPYKVYSQLITDLFAGQVAFIIGGTPVLIPHVQAGRVRALAISTAKRVPALPDVPTFNEAGVADFWLAPWYGVLVPAKTPTEVIQALNEAFRKSLGAADIIATATAEGQTLIGSTPDEFGSFIKSETERYRKLIRDAHIGAD